MTTTELQPRLERVELTLDELGEAIRKITEWFIEACRAVGRLFVSFAKVAKVDSAIINRALHHPKPRTRKKNLARIMKYFRKIFAKTC
jgi:hypothetical protein